MKFILVVFMLCTPMMSFATDIERLNHGAAGTFSYSEYKEAFSHEWVSERRRVDLAEGIFRNAKITTAQTRELLDFAFQNAPIEKSALQRNPEDRPGKELLRGLVPLWLEMDPDTSYFISHSNPSTRAYWTAGLRDVFIIKHYTDIVAKLSNVATADEWSSFFYRMNTDYVAAKLPINVVYPNLEAIDLGSEQMFSVEALLSFQLKHNTLHPFARKLAINHLHLAARKLPAAVDSAIAVYVKFSQSSDDAEFREAVEACLKSIDSPSSITKDIDVRTAIYRYGMTGDFGTALAKRYYFNVRDIHLLDYAMSQGLTVVNDAEFNVKSIPLWSIVADRILRETDQTSYVTNIIKVINPEKLNDGLMSSNPTLQHLAWIISERYLRITSVKKTKKGPVNVLRDTFNRMILASPSTLPGNFKSPCNVFDPANQKPDEGTNNP